MKNNLVVVFAVLLLLVLSSKARAYPGAKASDLKQTVTLKSMCKDRLELVTTSHFYTIKDMKYGPQGCPKGAILEVVAYPVRVSSFDAVKAAGVDGWALNKYDEGMIVYKMAYRTQALASTGAIHFQSEIKETQYDQLDAIAQTISELNPATAKVDFSARDITAFQAKPNLPSQLEVKIISVCHEKKGAIRGYTVPQGSPSVEGECPTPYQFSFDRTSSAVDDPYRMYFNQLRGTAGYYTHQFVAQHIRVLSRFGNPLFSHAVTTATMTQATLDLTTASPENPVSVWIDTDAKVVLKMKPSISPFAL